MPKVRVLVVDDAVVIRRILTDAISGDPELEVVGTAANGAIALQKITQLNPDILTLDIEMPEMDGIETLKNLRKTHPKLPVIMFSTLTEKGASATLDALAAGASDYVTKPGNVGNVTASKETVQLELIRKIKALVPRVPVQTITLKEKPKSTGSFKSAYPNLFVPRIDAVLIGVSTGGPNALAEVLPRLPEDLGVPILIVQHMPPMFTQLLAERLSAQSKLKVVEAKACEEIVANKVYIAPGGYHLEVLRSNGKVHTQLHQGPMENSCRPAVDVLFRSAAPIYGKNTLAIILTGMGQDGLHGCEHIKEVGGRIVAQDKATSVVWGMPGYVVEAKLADSVLPLSEIAQEIVRCVTSGRKGSTAPRTETQRGVAK